MPVALENLLSKREITSIHLNSQCTGDFASTKYIFLSTPLKTTKMWGNSL